MISPVKFHNFREHKMALPRNADIMAWDNGGKTADRYTIAIRAESGWDIYTMSADPSAVNQFSHNAKAFNEDPAAGKRVPLHKLPKAVIAAIKKRQSPEEEKMPESKQLGEEATSELWIEIDGEKIDVSSSNTRGYLPMVDLDDRTEWYVAQTSEEAGQAAMKYWEEMAEQSPDELASLIGEKTLIQWGMGKHAGPGSSQVRSLKEWIALWENTPEEQWASYDGEEHDVVISDALAKELDLEPGKAVAYRHN